jgi:hypothetical protein
LWGRGCGRGRRARVGWEGGNKQGLRELRIGACVLGELEKEGGQPSIRASWVSNRACTIHLRTQLHNTPEGEEGRRRVPKGPRRQPSPRRPRRRRHEERLQPLRPQRRAAARDGGDGSEGVAAHGGVAWAAFGGEAIRFSEGEHGRVARRRQQT